VVAAWQHWWPAVGGALVALLLMWLALIVALWRVAPDQPRLRDMLRLLPDTVGMLRRMAGDRALPRSIRIRLWLLLAYLASPIDVVPDFIPLLGYADDAILVVLVLRSVARRAGTEALTRHWHGTSDGLAAVSRLAGIPLARGY
jgi:uncharacterized membrane protein YkvA (DUF1232 family)